MADSYMGREFCHSFHPLLFTSSLLYLQAGKTCFHLRAGRGHRTPTGCHWLDSQVEQLRGLHLPGRTREQWHRGHRVQPSPLTPKAPEGTLNEHPHNLWPAASHHIEDGHHQYEGGGHYGDDQSQPGFVGNDDVRGSGKPGKGAERTLPSLLRVHRNTENDYKRRTRREKGDRHSINASRLKTHHGDTRVPT